MADRMISLSVNATADDYFQTFQKLSEVAAEMSGEHDYVSVSSSNLTGDSDSSDESEQLYHDEMTLFKVSKVLMDLEVSSEMAADIINGIQNAGILFRERARK